MTRVIGLTGVTGALGGRVARRVAAGVLGHRSPDRRWYPDVWDLPGGHVDDGESPAAALVREVREELGIRIEAPPGPPDALLTGYRDLLAHWLRAA